MPDRNYANDTDYQFTPEKSGNTVQHIFSMWIKLAFLYLDPEHVAEHTVSVPPHDPEQMPEHSVAVADPEKMEEHTVAVPDPERMVEHTVAVADPEYMAEHILSDAGTEHMVEHTVAVPDPERMAEHTVVSNTTGETLDTGRRSNSYTHSFPVSFILVSF